MRPHMYRARAGGIAAAARPAAGDSPRIDGGASRAGPTCRGPSRSCGVRLAHLNGGNSRFVPQDLHLHRPSAVRRQAGSSSTTAAGARPRTRKPTHGSRLASPNAIDECQRARLDVVANDQKSPGKR